jgi:hypothetical protein
MWIRIVVSANTIKDGHDDACYDRGVGLELWFDTRRLVVSFRVASEL